MKVPHPMKDLIVVIPGIMGSTLSRDKRPVWEPSSGAVIEALRTVFHSITTLRLPDGIGDDHPGDGVEPRALMPDIRLPLGLWTFDRGYTELLTFLRATFALSENTLTENPPDSLAGAANMVTFPYDWRLSNRYNGARLGGLVEPALQRWQDTGPEHADAKLVFICHSMGGLVARWYIDHLGGANHTRKLITLGTPHRGALKALEQLVNGAHKGPGPFKINLNSFARSLPSLHQLLPEYACIEHRGNLAKTTELTLPELTTAMVQDAMTFHTQIDTARKGSTQRPGSRHLYELHPVLGFDQPTWTTATLAHGRVRPIGIIKGDDERGDATVPRLSATPPDIAPDSAIPKRVADNHGGLVHNQNVYDELEGILTASPVVHRGGDIGIAVDIDEILDPGEPLEIRAGLPGGEPIALEAAIAAEHGATVEVVRLNPTTDGYRARIELPTGGYRVIIRGVGPAGQEVSPVTALVLAWPADSFDSTD